jgi:hypothetical protein
MTELMKIEGTAPVSKLVWLILAVSVALANNYLLLVFTSKAGNFSIASICSIIVSYVFTIWGDKLRAFSMPAAFYTHGILDCMEKKIFWRIGPQVIGIMLGQLAVWGTFFVFF